MLKEINIRVCLAIIENNKILLVPHYGTDAGAVQWVVPGGKLEFGESLKEAAFREFFEETGFQTEVGRLINVSEVILPKEHYHSITISFSGKIIGGELQSEENHRYGEKVPGWFSAEEVKAVKYHPEKTVEVALDFEMSYFT